MHEQKFKKKENEEHVLQITGEKEQGRSQQWTRGRGGFRGSVRGRGGRGLGRGAVNKALIECYKCHKLGHYQYECPKWENNANYAEFDEAEEMVLMAHAEIERKEKVWFLDSGCSNHMCGEKEWFSDIDEDYKHHVKLGDNSKMAVMGKGNVRMEIGGASHIITNVYYIPELKNNLISIGQLLEKGFSILMQNGVCRLYHPSRGFIMETVMTVNRMFVVTAKTMPQESTCFKTSSEDNTFLWHCRYGHLSYKGLMTLKDGDMVKGLPEIKAPSKLCEDCLVGKQQRDVIPKKSNWRAAYKLQLIHSDLCGPITPESSSQKRYIITFIDDYSRKCWVYFLSEKSEALEAFKRFKALVERETGLLIKCLRTDRGGEYNSNEFKELCASHGIQRQLTAAYTPQQNGVAERKNRTVLNMVRSMMTGKNVPKRFWPEATNWSVYILNRSPTTAVEGMTPEEAWSDQTPSVGHFKLFGCIAHAHIPKEKRKKLDDKSIKCVMFGVSEESKAYRLYNPVDNNIITSRDVVFDEDAEWEWTKDSTEESNDLSINEDEDNNGESGNEAENVTQHGGEDEETPAVAEQINQGGRPRTTPAWMRDYVSGEEISEEEGLVDFVMFMEVFGMFSSITDPSSFEEAVQEAKWREAMDREIESIEKNETWELCSLPHGVNTIGVKWIFKTKLNETGEVDKCKARLVAKGYAQKYGIDYTEVFAPVARWDTIRAILAVAAQKGMKVYQLDVKSAFLYGEITETVYVDQPKGYEKKGHESKVYKLKKALYGLKQAPRAWYSRIERFFTVTGLEKCPHEPTLFFKADDEGNLLIVSLYVDDMIVTGSNSDMVEDFKASMKTEFDMSDLGEMRYFLGVEIIQDETGIYMCQRKYAREILERFKMEECNAVRNPIVPGTKLVKEDSSEKVDASLYKQMVGCLMYLAATRPDLVFVLSLISRFMDLPSQIHMGAVKRVLRYVKGTINLGMHYRKSGSSILEAYSDSDYAGDLDTRKSTSGYVFFLSNAAISWSSKRQPMVTLSTTEAEFVAAATCACQVIWLRRILESIGMSQQEGGSTIMNCDNMSTIKLSKNPVMHKRSKHIDVRFHFLRDLTNDGVVELVHCSTQRQIADIMTKPLKMDTYEKLREMLGVCEVPNIN